MAANCGDERTRLPRPPLFGSVDRQLDLDDQPGIGVSRGHSAFVQRDGPAGDRQAQAQAAAGAVSGFLDAIERLEDLGERVWRNARALVTNGNRRQIVLDRNRDLDRARRGRMAGLRCARRFRRRGESALGLLQEMHCG